MNRLILVIFIALLTGACKKDQFIYDNNARTTVSTDTLHFDTVFTSAGSITKKFKIYNLNDQKLMVSSIRLAGGTNSSFKININGQAATEEHNIEIPAEDSIYVFVQVFIDPTNAGNPFIVSDSIEISCNGNNQWVQLQAYGQNAHFLNNHSITTDETWENDLPYIISGELKITQNGSLTIQKGVRVYAHGKAAMLVHGSLLVMGESGDSNKVIFTNDRLDDPYNSLPGSWRGIFFEATSSGNDINWAVIKNAEQAISLEKSTGANFQLSIKNSIIDNCTEAAIFSNGSSIYADNCLFSNNGQGVHIDNGGKYHFIHCTLVAYANNLVQHIEPLVYISDSFEEAGQSVAFITNVLFENCIIWGDENSGTSEVITNRKGIPDFDIHFKNCLIRSDALDDLQKFDDCYLNIDPMFVNSDPGDGAFDFHLLESSPAIDKGIQTAVTEDLDNNTRSLPDMGCYEFTP